MIVQIRYKIKEIFSLKHCRSIFTNFRISLWVKNKMLPIKLIRLNLKEI